MNEESNTLPGEVVKLLEARAVRLAAPPRALESEEDNLWFATFEVGDLDVAIPLGQLRAALPLKRVAPVPLAPPEVVGILRWSGQVLTVYSLGFMLGGQASRADSNYLVVVERGPNRLVAFDCGQIPLATTRAAREIEQARTRARDKEPVMDVARGTHVLSVVDIEALLQQWEARRGA